MTILKQFHMLDLYPPLRGYTYTLFPDLKNSLLMWFKHWCGLREREKSDFEIEQQKKQGKTQTWKNKTELGEKLRNQVKKKVILSGPTNKPTCVAPVLCFCCRPFTVTMNTSP